MFIRGVKHRAQLSQVKLSYMVKEKNWPKTELCKYLLTNTFIQVSSPIASICVNEAIRVGKCLKKHHLVPLLLEAKFYLQNAHLGLFLMKSGPRSHFMKVEFGQRKSTLNGHELFCMVIL